MVRAKLVVTDHRCTAVHAGTHLRAVLEESKIEDLCFSRRQRDQQIPATDHHSRVGEDKQRLPKLFLSKGTNRTLLLSWSVRAFCRTVKL